MQSRDAVLDRLRRHPEAVQVLIVGAGINGIGLYRDLAAQGVPALLIDQEDFCSGTSAAPSRLAHGGLRYLETGEFALVRESVEERNRLLHNAPHLVQPLPVWLPLRSHWAGLLHAPLRFLKWTRRPGAKGAVVTRLALWFYDWFGRRLPALPRHRMVSGEELRRTLPGMDPGVKLAAEYHDARLVHPERLALELIADAERDCPEAMALNWLALDSHRDGRVSLRDRLGGGVIAVQPRLLVNAAGAWVDRVHAQLGIGGRLMGGTRGSHLVLRHPVLAQALGGRMVYFETPDHRICLAYPLPGDRVLLGTTDLRSDDPDDKQCTAAEVDYLFEVLHGLFPGLALAREHIVFQYAGVRPLPHSGAEVAGAISRDHQLRHYPADPARPFHVLTLVGGKWTTYRVCAQQMADAVLAQLGRTRRQHTDRLPIGGGRDWPADPRQAIASVQHRHAADPALVHALWSRYGTGFEAVLQTVLQHAATAGSGGGGSGSGGGSGGDGGTALAPDHGLPAYHEGELLHLLRHERVGRLSDLLLRRTLLAFYGGLDGAGVRRLGELAAQVLGWSPARTDEEVSETLGLLQRRHAVRI